MARKGAGRELQQSKISAGEEGMSRMQHSHVGLVRDDFSRKMDVLFKKC